MNIVVVVRRESTTSSTTDLGRADRKEHPECLYSSSISHACGTVDSKRICETIRRVLRDCPNWWPEHIHEHVTRHDGETSSTGGPTVVHDRLYKAEPVSPKLQHPTLSILFLLSTSIVAWHQSNMSLSVSCSAGQCAFRACLRTFSQIFIYLLVSCSTSPRVPSLFVPPYYGARYIRGRPTALRLPLPYSSGCLLRSSPALAVVLSLNRVSNTQENPPYSCKYRK